jgi:hypothetical protein
LALILSYKSLLADPVSTDDADEMDELDDIELGVEITDGAGELTRETGGDGLGAGSPSSNTSAIRLYIQVPIT